MLNHNAAHPNDPNSAQNGSQEPTDLIHAAPAAIAETAGLVYVHANGAGFRRRPRGKGFSYLDPKGRVVTDTTLRRRFNSLAIPPAWTDVWICREQNGHLQVTGRDEQGRKQYIYHPRWIEARTSTKFDRMTLFAEALPKIRVQVDADLRRHSPTFEKIVALVVRLLDNTWMRVGNEEYVRLHESYGLTTLLNEHVTLAGSRLIFDFRGKSGQEQHIELKDRRLARLVQQCQELPGQKLFQFRNEAGELQPLTSGDVNTYLHTITGDTFTAKDFRTWGGTVAAAKALFAFGPGETKKEIKARLRGAVKAVSEQLGNTTTVCRQYYIHPTVLASYEAGTLCALIEKVAANYVAEPHSLDATETAVYALLTQS
jgi:DNA topoisomerase-1